MREERDLTCLQDVFKDLLGVQTRRQDSSDIRTRSGDLTLDCLASCLSFLGSFLPVFRRVSNRFLTEFFSSPTSLVSRGLPLQGFKLLPAFVDVGWLGYSNVKWRFDEIFRPDPEFRHVFLNGDAVYGRFLPVLLT